MPPNQQALRRVKNATTFFAIGLMCCVVTNNAAAQSKPFVSASAADIRTAILFGSVETQAAVERANNDRRALYRELESAVAEKRRALRIAAISEKKRKQLEVDLSLLRQRQGQLIVELANADEKYSLQIKAFREGLNVLLENPEPRFKAALQRYADGDISALDDLQEITRLRRQALLAGLTARIGEEQRTIARLWMNAADRGQKTLKQALDAWQEAAEVDPKNFESWEFLARLSLDSADYGRAEAAGRKALTVAVGDEQEGAATQVIGLALTLQGNLLEARKYLQRSIDSSRKVVADNATELFALRDLGAILNHFSDVEAYLGNLDSAERGYRESLSIRRKLGAAFPYAQGAYRDLGVSVTRLGRFLAFERRKYDEARPFFVESVKIFRDLQRMNPESSQGMRDTLISLKTFAFADYMYGRPDEAKSLATEYLDISIPLQMRDRTSKKDRFESRELMVLLGTIALEQKEFSESRKWFSNIINEARRDVLDTDNFVTNMEVVNGLIHLIDVDKAQGAVDNTKKLSAEARALLDRLAAMKPLSSIEQSAVTNALARLQ